MDQQLREAAVTALVALASSDDYQDRAAAGRALANFADHPTAHPVLVSLVLDPHDTFVTLETATALLRRADTAGLVTVAEAVSSADDQHLDHIHDAVGFAYFGPMTSDRDKARHICAELTHHPDQAVRQGLRDLHEMIPSP